MTAPFNERFSADKSLMQSQLAAYRAALAAHPAVTTVAFPALAARFGVHPRPRGPVECLEGEKEVERVLGSGMGMNLVPGQGVYAGAGVTRGEFEGYVGGLVVAETKSGGGVLSETEAREACRDFFGHYAFQVPPGTTTAGGGGAANGTTREACVYLLASMINHCCTPAAATTTNPSGLKTGSGRNRSGGGASGPNCSWRIGPSGLAHFIKPRHICVQARRAIREGEQLTWDYGKQEKGFACECDTCRDSLMGGLGSVCGVL
jgi:hypothetical protein